MSDKSHVLYFLQATESHELVASRTSELERIHTTSITLHQLKAFVHAKSELDAYIKSPDDKGNSLHSCSCCCCSDFYPSAMLLITQIRATCPALRKLLVSWKSFF